MERQPSIISLAFWCCGKLNLFGKKHRQKQLSEMANLEALCRESIRVERDLEQMKLELEKKKKQERNKLVKQRKAEKKTEKREMDWLHWITTKCLITRREERQELERLRNLDVQLQLKDLRDLERQIEEQKRIEIMERKHQKASRKGWTEHCSKYRVDRLEDMENKRDNEHLGDSLTDEDLVREPTSLKESFAQQDRERGKWDKCENGKKMLTMLQETEIEEELRRQKRKLQVRSMHKGKSRETQLQTNVERTQMQPEMEKDRLLEHLKEDDTKRWKDKCKKMERLLATEREMAEVREMAMLEEIKRKRESEKLDLERQLMKRQRQMEKMLEEKMKAFEMEREKLNELLREQEVRQKEIKFGLIDLETKAEEKWGDSKKQEHVTHHRWLEMEEKDQRLEESLQEIKKQIEHEQFIETDEGQQEIQKMQTAGQKPVEKSREMRLEMETARVTERQISEAREKAKRETEIQTEKQTEIKTQQEKRQRKQEMEKQREEEELKRNLEMLKTRMKNEEQEYNEMHRVIQKELEKDNLKKEPKESEREEEMENENEKMAENMAVKEKCKWIEMQFDKERKVVEERAMALLEKSERTGESNRQDMDRQKMEKERQIGGELQINNTKIEREKQKVTEQKEKQRKVEEHFWDTANLAKSEEIKKLSPKNEESFEIDLELQSQMGERNQRKEAMLMETEKQRDEEPMKERQERQLKIQQMQEARQKHAERQTKRKRELMQKLFPQIVSPSLQKEGDGGKKTERRRHRIPLNKEQQQESSEQGKEHQEQVELQSDRRNRQLDKMKKGIQTVLQEMNRQKAMERLQIKERQEEIKGQLKVKTSERQDMKRQLMEKERQVRKESQINKTEIEREKQKVLVTEQEEKQRTMEEHLWDTESLPKFDEIQKCSSKYEEKLNERNQRKKEMLLETEKQRDEEPMKDRQARLLKIQQMQEARQKHAEKQTKRKRELMLKIFSQRMSPVYKEHQHKHQQEHQLEHQQESSEPEQKNQEQVRFQRPVSSSGVWLINIKPLESSKGPAEQQMKLDQLSTSAPETQPEESVRDKSSYDPEDPEPQALTQPKTVEEQSLETSVPPDGSEDSGEMAVEMKDVTSQDTESEKRDGPKHKSIRRRIFGWINKKLKESHKNAIAKSFETEKKHGDRRYLMRNTRQWTTEAAIQQQKREGLQKKEKKREELEARWRAWEEKRAKKKEEKKEEEKRKAEEEHEIPHLKTYAYCYIR